MTKLGYHELNKAIRVQFFLLDFGQKTTVQRSPVLRKLTVLEIMSGGVSKLLRTLLDSRMKIFEIVFDQRVEQLIMPEQFFDLGSSTSG